MQKSGSRCFHQELWVLDVSLPRVELEELGPGITLCLDRTKEPEKEKWKQSIKVPKAAKPKKAGKTPPRGSKWARGCVLGSLNCVR